MPILKKLLERADKIDKKKRKRTKQRKMAHVGVHEHGERGKPHPLIDW